MNQAIQIPPVLFATAFLVGLTLPLVAQDNSQQIDTVDEIRKAHDERPDDPPIANREKPTGDQSTSPPTIHSFGGFQSIQVNVDKNGNNIVGDAANEPSISMNRVNPENMVIGWRQFDSIQSNFRQAGVAYTDNGGLTWNNNGPLDQGIFRSDPVLTEDSNGNIFYYSLTTNNDLTAFFCDMFISMDGGVTWSDPIPAGGGDKQWLTVDNSGGTGDGFVYATWNPFFSCCPNGWFTRSTDNGLNYLQPVPLSDIVFWGTMSVGPDGEVYICGRSQKNIPTVMRSDNSQNNNKVPFFPQIVSVDLGGPNINSEGPNPGGLLGQFDVATDHSGSKTHGNVYLIGSIDPPGPDPLDIMFARSSDGGVTWSDPVRINTDQQLFGAYNWFGTMSVAPNGRIDVIWNDMRNDPGGRLSAMYYSASYDGGMNWTPNQQVAPEFDSLIGHPNQNKIGDYYDMRSTNTAAHVAYSATFNGEQDVYFLRIDAGNGILGDVNQDDVVNLLDIGPFVQLVGEQGYQFEADTNQDGLVDLLDVVPFVDILSEQ